MNKTKPRIRLVPLGVDKEFQDRLLFDDGAMSLGDFLAANPALAMEPLSPEILREPLCQLRVQPCLADPKTPLYRPPGLRLQPIVQVTPGSTSVPAEPSPPHTPPQPSSLPDSEGVPPVSSHPESISEKEATLLAYSREIETVASFLRSGLSVLVKSDKLVVEHLWPQMARKAMLVPKPLEVRDDAGGGGMMLVSGRQRQLAALKELITTIKQGQVVVVPHLDLLAGGSETNLPAETRELIEHVYGNSDRLLLAFADTSLEVSEVLAARFAVCVAISGVQRTVLLADDREELLGIALVTRKEADRFLDYTPDDFYKNVAGMNPIRLRHALIYAVNEYSAGDPVPVKRLYEAIRNFKVQTSVKFEVPTVTFNDIGGYQEVKAELNRSLRLMAGSYDLPDEKLRNELIPRGFLFHGPPGTGKTLFAKAIANSLDATVMVVSGPEITDKYVGESERKVRELFAEARRNAPAVLIFDEFDAIATERSGRDDGGTRAGNALVAQILTEMDGFRPEVPMLVIGTTNRIDIIDKALLRPSRFKPIGIGLPDLEARYAIARVHAGHFKVAVADELLHLIALATEGLNGDEVRSLFRDACIGLHCEEPTLPANAFRFGQLVGTLRGMIENLEKEESSHNSSRAVDTQGGTQRPAPRGGMRPFSEQEA